MINELKILHLFNLVCTPAQSGVVDVDRVNLDIFIYYISIY